MTSILAICGNSGEGKTKLASLAFTQATKRKWSCRGVFCPAVFEDGQKKAIDVCLIPTMQNRTLAQLAGPGDEHVFGKWNMNLESIAWARDYLLDIQAADLWIVDEIGPYEIERGQGWAEILPLLPQLPAKKVLITFRPKLLPWFLEHYPMLRVFHLSKPNAETSLINSLFL